MEHLHFRHITLDSSVGVALIRINWRGSWVGGWSSVQTNKSFMDPFFHLHLNMWNALHQSIDERVPMTDWLGSQFSGRASKYLHKSCIWKFAKLQNNGYKVKVMAWPNCNKLYIATPAIQMAMWKSSPEPSTNYLTLCSRFVFSLGQYVTGVHS